MQRRHAYTGPGATWFMCVLTAAALLQGCAGYPLSGDTFDELKDPGPTVPTPATPPNADDFLELVLAYCGDARVGDARVGDTRLGPLLATDPRFRALITGLFNGDLTNDELIRRVAERHPAPDANVEAMGCVVDQMQKCYSGRCAVPARRRLPEPVPPAADFEAWDTGV
jgi:hypothetical protein